MKYYLLFALLVLPSYTALTYSPCSSDQILNVKDLSCSSCPANKIPNPNQNIPTSCICTKGYYPNNNQVCDNILTSAGNCSNSNEFMEVFQKDGSVNTLPLSSCTACSSNSYPNSNGTGCTVCGANMQYSNGECTCTNSAFTKTDFGCFDPSLTTGLGDLSESSSIYYNKLKYLFPGCYHFGDYLSCSHLLNLCAYSEGNSSAQCNFFNTNSTFRSYAEVTNTDLYSMSAGSFDKNTPLSLKLISFLPEGNYVGEQDLKLPDILRCGLPSNLISLSVGNNFYTTCTYNFDYLAEKLSTFSYQNYVYQLFLADNSNNYVQVPVYFKNGDNPNTPFRRFFLEDTTSDSTSMNVLTNFKFQLTLNQDGVLKTPQIEVYYTKLTIQDGAVTPQTDKNQELIFQFTYDYDLTTFWSAFIPVASVVSALALVQAIIRTYIEYLNRGSPFSFFFYFAKFWSLWMFYFLLAISGYWFLFTKTTQSIFALMPQEQTFYVVFYVLAGIMGVFRIITVIAEKASKLNTEVFMINWEKGTFRNSWRQIFIINSLAEFYTHRTISLFWMLLCTMFFLVGLEWEDHSAEVPFTDLTIIYSTNPRNRVLLYFLGSSIFLIVGIVFKILRRLSVIAWPYPFEDFVDYCNVTNISFFFMKKRNPQAYYIHATIPDRTEVTYKEINQAIRRGLNKNRSIASEHTFHDHLKMYNVYICKQLEDKFLTMLKKEEDEEHNNQMKYTQTQSQQKLKPINIRDDFVERKLKPYLEVISREGSNRTKTTTESLFGFPPVDLRENNALKNTNLVIFDDKMDIVSDVFPNGNEFEELHTVIIIFLLFNLLSNSTAISAFVTFFIDTYMFNGWIENSCRRNLERMTKVKEGFML